jgi:hypothetical protein
VAFESKELESAIFEFSGGTNAGIAPLLLPANVLANGLNTTVRGSFVRPRPPVKKLTLSPDSVTLLTSALASGPFQGGCYYKPDNDDEALMASIGGRLIKIVPDSSNYTAVATEHTIAGDPNPPNDLQAWLWQSEKWVIVQNGANNPLFFDNAATVRSNYNSPTNYSTTVGTNFIIPAVGATVTVTFTSGANVAQGDLITVQNKGTYQVSDISGTPNIVLLNLTSGPVGGTITAGTALLWTHLGTELPPGRMGVYGLGRNWIALPDGKQFVASDLVGGSSGTQSENFRDAVLEITENLYLAGGGNFTVPGSVGDIQAMKFTATLDVSLGQGPLQVFTPTDVFSCQAPVDRLTWQDVTNPILTQSLIGNGGLAQNGTVSVNGDTIFRSIDGIRSLILARRDFDTWGNVPISREVEPQLSKDSPDLLGWCSAVVFDNRMLMTCLPVLHIKGIYWRGLIPLNFDPISTLRGKAPSVYDGTLWTGLNVLQLFTGQFNKVNRTYALCLDLINEPTLELYELLPSSTTEIHDDGTERITWLLESAVLFRENVNKRELLRLKDGEIWLDNIQGKVDVQVFYRPDSYPCWVPWHAFQVCENEDATKTTDGKPGYRTRLGIGEPSGTPCESSNNRPLRTGFWFQLRIVVTGHCEFKGARVKAVTEPQSSYAPIAGCVAGESVLPCTWDSNT